MPQKLECVIVGTGSVGTSLAIALSRKGYPIAGIASRSKTRATELAVRVGSPEAFTLKEALPTKTRLLFVCVPDDAIEPTARILCKKPLPSDLIAVHCSGSLTSEALSPFARLGVDTMSFHPMQTFSDLLSASFEGIYVGIEGTERAKQVGEYIAHELGAFSIFLEAEDKNTYHLAASMASNLFVALSSMSFDLLESIGFTRHEAAAILGPLIRQTTDNLSSMLPEKALTGPAARGDMNTIRFHFETLQTHSFRIRETYRILTEEAIQIAEKAGRLDAERANQLKIVLGDLDRHTQ